MNFLKPLIIVLSGLVTFVMLIPFSTLASTWINEVKEGEYVLCSNLPNQISPFSSPDLEGKSVTFFVSLHRNSSSSLSANLSGTLDGKRDNLREIGTDFNHGDEFNFEGLRWKIISIGEKGIYARKVNGQEYFLGYQYCSTNFIHLKLVGKSSE
jgi:hypothetical protein